MRQTGRPKSHRATLRVGLGIKTENQKIWNSPNRYILRLPFFKKRNLVLCSFLVQFKPKSRTICHQPKIPFLPTCSQSITPLDMDNTSKHLLCLIWMTQATVWTTQAVVWYGQPKQNVVYNTRRELCSICTSWCYSVSSV